MKCVKCSAVDALSYCSTCVDRERDLALIDVEYCVKQIDMAAAMCVKANIVLGCLRRAREALDRISDRLSAVDSEDGSK